jgi:hypothetical protein
MFNLFNDMRKVIKPGPKMNIIFQTDRGNFLNLVISYGVTIEQTLKYYLGRMARKYINSIDKINFLHNGKALNLVDKTPVEIFFKNNTNPKLSVSHSSNFDTFIKDWTEEEKNQIKFKLDEIFSEVRAQEQKFELENAQKINEEKEITIIFNKRGAITELRLSNYSIVAELIDEYYRITETNDGIFNFNGIILTPIDTRTLYKVGLEDNSEIEVR